MPGFVVQEHHARTHHFDFRLEREGVFKSWAVPKGILERPGVKRLAVQVEDLDLAFGDFQGTIPEGQYGAGEVRIWDAGEYVARHWKPDDIAFSLAGQRLHRDFRLVRFTHSKASDWLLFKSDPKP